MTSISEFLGKGRDYLQDIEMYESSRTKEIRKSNKKADAYEATPGEIGQAAKYRDRGSGIGPGTRAAANGASGLLAQGDVKNTFIGRESANLSSIGKGIGELFSSVMTANKGAAGITALFGALEGAENQGLEYLRQETFLRNEINSKMGVTGMLGNDIRDTILTSASYGQKFGVSIADATDAFINLSDETGRFATISSTILEKGFATAKAFLPNVGELGKAFAEFEKVGIGANNTLSQINDIAKQSMVIGLNGQKTVAEVRANIEKLNSYNFKNGTEGLAQMSRIAKIFRTDMNDAFTVAEKVMDPEGAIEMSARLQALGGSIGEFNDVYKLMYDSVNDPGAIQKALISMSSGLSSYNEQAGKFEMTAVGIRMLREQAKITGADYNSLARGAIAAQEKIRGLQQLSASGLDIKGDQKDFLLNLARMEGGEMKITIPNDLKDKFVGIGKGLETELKETGMLSLRNLNQEAFSRFAAYQDQFKDAFPEDIARGQYTLIQNISNDVGALTSFARARAVQTIGGTLKAAGGEGIPTLGKLLDLNVTKLTEASRSGIGYSKSVRSTVDDALNFISMGLVGKAKAAINKADIQLSKELFDLKEKKNKQNGSTGQIKTNSLIEETVGGRSTSSTNSNAPINGTTNVIVSFRPSDNMTNEFQRAAIKNPELYRMITGQESKYSYTNSSEMIGA